MNRKKPEELSPTVLRSQRLALKLSQSALSRQSNVLRQNICNYELGGGALTTDEQNRIRKALQREAEHLRNVAINFDMAATSAPVGV
jgi:transcriptional regulator with XRE-family HTH domain